LNLDDVSVLAKTNEPPNNSRGTKAGTKAGSIRQRIPGVWKLRMYIGRDRTGRVRHK